MSEDNNNNQEELDIDGKCESGLERNQDHAKH